MKNLLIILILTLTYNLNAQTQWSWQMPQPNGNGLDDIKYYNSNIGYACGHSGTILKTTNGGNNWFNLTSGISTFIRSLYLFDSVNVIACGDSGRVLKTSNGGNSWNLIITGITTLLNSITFTNSLTGYISGHSNIVLKTTNGGFNWFNLNSGTSTNFLCIAFANENIGYASGNAKCIKTTNAGANWFDMGITFSLPFSIVYEVSIIDSNNVYLLIGGDERIAYTSNGGVSWDYYDVLLPQLEGGGVDEVRGISFINLQTGYLVSDGGSICKTTNKGQNWIQNTMFRTKFHTHSVFFDVFVNQDEIYAVGGGGTIVKSTNSGANYFLQSGYKQDLSDIRFVNENTGFAIGEWGEFYKTTNSGVNWIQKNIDTQKDLNSIFFVNEQTGYIAGDTGLVLKTTNSGENWVSLSTGRNNILNDIYFTNQFTGYICGTLGLVMKTTNEGLNWFRLDSVENKTISKIYFVNENTGIAIADNWCLRTTNAGTNWIVQPNANGRAIYFINENTGYLGSGSRMYKTTNSGESWTQIFSRSGWVFQDLYFGNEMEGIGVGYASQELLVKTTNGGVNWFRLFATNSVLYGVDFINGETGYIAGDWGNILKTTNGGLTFINENHNEVVSGYELKQNYPNPFNPSTNIEFNIPHFGFAKLSVYDITGKEVAVLINKELSSGVYNITWNASALPSGVYFYTLKVNPAPKESLGKTGSGQTFTQTKKMILMK